MKYFRFVTHATAALFAVRQQAADATPDEGNSAKDPKYGGTSTKVNCLSAFNEARTAAGLVPFTEAAADSWLQSKDATSESVCKAIIEETPVDNSMDFTSTVALAIQDGDAGDCAAAVTHFNGALANFGSLPPAFDKDLKVYKSLQAISFVALYNPKDNPKLDCAYFSCSKNATTTAEADDLESRTQETVVATKKGLLCTSSPLALIAGQEPFEQKQFDKIKAAISSAGAVVPAYVTLVVTAAGLFLF